ncbi:helix-turn-helix domain-containing protein [Niallia taxi]|uniref:helix-turn-helix domain-containing protein n=1 Tax=Niallia taxi TaxID=2499688 RepID=UPI00254FE5F9|nr:helix-turn-helix domain-containing protein [Niallia taxi]MDK8641305.1 helix-turn-helix domain-containing protein [Niallia taxi]
MTEVIYTVKETAELLKCNKNYVYSLLRKGHLKCLKLGQLKIPAYEIDDFLRRNIGKDFSNQDHVTELVFNEGGELNENQTS